MKYFLNFSTTLLQSMGNALTQSAKAPALPYNHIPYVDDSRDTPQASTFIRTLSIHPFTVDFYWFKESLV